MDISAVKNNPRLLIALGAAFIQGVVLYGLHRAISHEEWAQEHLALLSVLYAVAVFVPLTIQLLSEHWRAAYLWRAVAGIGLLYALLGWHFGAKVALPARNDVLQEDDAFIFGLNLAVIWILFLPFLRCRLNHGGWRSGYPQLFAAAWQNVLMLAEAAAFTGAFWLLLLVWQQLFLMLGYPFFNNLFERPAFVYPVTAVTFGVALYLAGSIERLVSVMREQILGLLKWLAPLAALILVLFTPALLFKLPDLVFRGERAIKSMWLLWLLALTVLLLNAGYQNGAAEKPYPRFLQIALRIAVPTMVIVAATALYSLVVRISEYGITVGRVYAVVVAVVALGYSVGYTLAAARRGGPWLKGIERVNVAVALGIMGVLILLLTPVASPYRLAANSQFERLLTVSGDERENKLKHLRWDAGRYGLQVVERLAAGKAGKTPEGLVEDSQYMLAAENKYSPVTTQLEQSVMARLAIFPQEHAVEPQLATQLQKAIRNHVTADARRSTMVVFIDLDGTLPEECVLISKDYLGVYAKTKAGDQWEEIGYSFEGSGDPELGVLREALKAGDFAPHTQKWSDLRIGNKVLRLNLDSAPGTEDVLTAQ